MTNQSTAFSFSRFLVPRLMDYQGWAISMDCDMLARGNIAELRALRDPRYALQCVQHGHEPGETVKFLGEVLSAYPNELEPLEAIQLRSLHRTYRRLWEQRQRPGTPSFRLAAG